MGTLWAEFRYFTELLLNHIFEEKESVMSTRWEAVCAILSVYQGPGEPDGWKCMVKTQLRSIYKRCFCKIMSISSSQVKDKMANKLVQNDIKQFIE